MMSFYILCEVSPPLFFKGAIEIKFIIIIIIISISISSSCSIS